MPVVTTVRREGESDKDYAKREIEHWEAVRKNEAKLLAARQAHEKRMGR